MNVNLLVEQTLLTEFLGFGKKKLTGICTLELKNKKVINDIRSEYPHFYLMIEGILPKYSIWNLVADQDYNVIGWCGYTKPNKVLLFLDHSYPSYDIMAMLLTDIYETYKVGSKKLNILAAVYNAKNMENIRVKNTSGFTKL
jgi:hypothetical protein